MAVPEHPSVSAPLDERTLATIADGLACADPAAFLPSGDGRRWAQIASTSSYSAWVIAWPGGTGLGMHDHDGSAAAVRVVSGTLRERYVQPGGIAVRWLTSPGVTLLAADHVHEVINVGADEAISVHVYSPPLADTSFRDDPEIVLR